MSLSSNIKLLLEVVQHDLLMTFEEVSDPSVA